MKTDALPRFMPNGTGATITDIVSNYQNLPATIKLALPSGNTGVIEYRYDTEGRQISRWSWELDAVTGEKVAGTEGNEWSYYDALGRLDARVGIANGVLDHRLVNVLTEAGEQGNWYRREFMNSGGTDDLPLPGSLTRNWSTYGARGLLAQTRAPMTGTQPLESDVLRGEIVLNDHLGSPRLRVESHTTVPDDRSVIGWMPKNPMDYTPFGRELPQSPDTKTTPEGYTGKPLDTTFGLQTMNYGARFYDPRLGRWWQRDPLAEEFASVTSYGYVESNPVGSVDKDGCSGISFQAAFTFDNVEVIGRSFQWDIEFGVSPPRFDARLTSSEITGVSSIPSVDAAFGVRILPASESLRDFDVPSSSLSLSINTPFKLIQAYGGFTEPESGDDVAGASIEFGGAIGFTPIPAIPFDITKTENNKTEKIEQNKTGNDLRGLLELSRENSKTFTDR
ncbi:MAG: RHS repeat-associated core domain-containing protein [Candidatus Delongbacteria bacterium]